VLKDMKTRISTLPQIQYAIVLFPFYFIASYLTSHKNGNKWVFMLWCFNWWFNLYQRWL